MNPFIKALTEGGRCELMRRQCSETSSSLARIELGPVNKGLEVLVLLKLQKENAKKFYQSLF